MRKERVLRCLGTILLGVGAALLVRSDSYAAKATTKDLGGPDRFLTHVSTDKPIYRGGERVYVRGVILNAHDHTPLKPNQQATAVIEVKGPKGDTVAQGTCALQDSVLGFQWPIPAGQAGGEYTLKVTYPWHGYPPAERKFDIRAYRAPRLRSQIVFLRDGYGPGDQVSATLHVERAEGGIPVGAKVAPIARVDGEEVFRGAATVDAAGNCTAQFKLPAEIARGEGSLAMVIEDGGVVETAAKTIPILLQTVDLTMYPEGGDLVAGLPTRVYLEAKTPAKKPADIAGLVVDAQGNQVAAFRTEHEGRGRFALTPQRGGKYTLRIAEPRGIKTTYPLPAVRDTGGILRALDNLTDREQPVRLRVGSTAGGKLTVTLTQREIEVSSVTWNATPGIIADVVLTPPASVDGVLVATLWDATGKPLAERLIFRRPAASVRVELIAQRPSHVPGETAKLTIKTTDDAGKPVSSIVGLTVTDDSVLEMIEKREQAPRLPVMVLLESDVRELADAHVYLDPANPKAPAAVDLLLGTQGWRRFALVDAAKFVASHGDSARRVLALCMATRRERWGAMKGRGAIGGALPEGAAAPGEDMDLGAAPDAAAPEEKVAAEAPRPAAPPAARPAPEPPAKPDAKPEAELRRHLADALDKQQAAQEALLAAEDIPVAGRLRRSDLIAVREYAHKVRPGRKPNDRIDFAETLYWTAGVKTDPKTGEATVEFGLSDAVTTFRVFADAFGADGALGASTGSVESVKPFYIEPKLPLEVTAGDVVQIPVGFVNGIESGMPRTTISVQADPELKVTGPDPFDLGAKARERRIVAVKVGYLNTASDFVIQAVSGAYADKVTRKLSVKPLGFPVEVAFGGLTVPNGAATHTIEIPADVVPRSITTNVAAYPTPLANLTEALARLIRDPNGCFEQTSSTTYPLVMAQQYFLTHTGVDPQLIERARTSLDKGYARLVSFECKQKGYEWFGGDPGHEALSAYGLLEFTDMAQVRDVDGAMIQRTRGWLLARRDGKGSFQRNARALDSFGGAPQEHTDAYCVWALLEAGEKGLDKEIAYVKDLALKSKDSYIVALGANILALGKHPDARKLMDKLAASQNKEGAVDGAVTSITRSGGQALQIETTSLAILAWLREPACAGAVEKAMKFVAESCKAGRFGSTQSTVLALRAIVTYDKLRARPKAPGSVRIVVDGQPVGDAAKFDKETQGAIQLPDISELLTAGKHTLEVRMDGGAAMPYSLAVNYHNVRPASAKECKVGLKVALRDKQVTEGALTEAAVQLENLNDGPLPMTLAIVGIPGGLEPRHDQLKELVKSGAVAAYEVIGRDVVLYWRQMKAGEKIAVPISCVAAVPGTYTGPASRAYLYYTDEHKCWVEGLKVIITPRPAGQPAQM